jgi:hypothetical protein
VGQSDEEARLMCAIDGNSMAQVWRTLACAIKLRCPKEKPMAQTPAPRGFSQWRTDGAWSTLPVARKLLFSRKAMMWLLRT